MEKTLLQQINEQTDIVDLVSEFVDLSKRGKNYMGLCPFHQEKTPSFSVSPEKNIAKCMSCGEGGTPVNFYRKIKNISRDQAMEELAERAGIAYKKTKVKKDPHETHYALMKEVSEFYQFNLFNSKKGQAALDYLYKRQLSDDQIRHFYIGYAPPYGDDVYRLLKDKGFSTTDMIALGIVKQSQKGDYYDLFSDRIIFPITNPNGHVVGFSGRTMDPNEQVKYINSPETPIFKKGQLLYHFHDAASDIRKQKHVVLFEGFFDVIAAYSADIKNGVATMGTALTSDQAKLIKSATDAIIIAYDGDKAGLKATDQAIDPLIKAKLKTHVLTIPDKMDPDEFVKAYGPESFEKLFQESVEDPYRFRYGYYKQGIDFNNANDLKSFKDKVLGMLRYAEDSVKSIYINKLAHDLNVDPKSLSITQPRETREVILPKKVTYKHNFTKYVNAEIYLILAMLLSKSHYTYISKKVKANESAEKLNGLLRLQISQYYDRHDVMDLNLFLDQLTDELRQHFMDVIQKNILYGKIKSVAEGDIDQHIRVLKDIGMARRLAHLIDEIAKWPENHPKRIEMVEEKDQLQRKLKHSK